MQILVGCDPEVFVKKGKSFYSADGLIPGTKEHPYPVDNGAVQVDGMALEFNINPAETEDEFAYNVLSVLDQLRRMVPDYEIVIVPTATFPEKHFDAQSEKAKELGCEPDFDAYKEGGENARPNNKSRMRTAAGHIHVGWTNGEDPKDPVHFQRCITLVKHLDAYLGVPSVLWDKETKRRTMYGRAGAFRPKSYGVEYRTLSNAWLRDERLIRYVYRQTIRAVEALIAGERFGAAEGMFPMYINSSNETYAEHYLRSNCLKHLEYPPVTAA